MWPVYHAFTVYSNNSITEWTIAAQVHVSLANQHNFKRPKMNKVTVFTGVLGREGCEYGYWLVAIELTQSASPASRCPLQCALSIVYVEYSSTYVTQQSHSSMPVLWPVPSATTSAQCHDQPPEEAGHSYITTQLLLLIEKCPCTLTIAGNGEKC